MEILLNDVEVRVLGCLIEKELATPEYYPLTLNSLTTACNQKSNRDPVMALEESEVVRALDGLKMKHVAIQAADSGRVPRYRHILAERLRFSPAELAILAELLLRGPQTLGELRTRAERMHPFTDLTAVEQVLGELAERTPPRVMRLPRQPGRKESRFAHLLAGEPDLSAEERPAPPEGARLQVMAENERLAALESEVAALRAEVAELRQVMEEFRSQFE
ncbi:YceH family protein [Geobacter anodireducens]|uniref:YceH family protein n=1 Tax=Geobacter anodireducens TaxID=1340425 RepID=A0ABR9NQS5_9BACT|nr:YceH family protein [Geobacter anodireducens]MBE2886615.1 YceH family protein [Geobacter anodireducens]HMN01234.1 YceH family protein [Geobacter anodireducens]